MKRSSSVSPCLFLYKRCDPFFSGTDQWKKKAYKTFIDTITSTVTCHRTQTHGFTCTYRHSVGFHWGLPMNLCNLYRKTINARGRTEFGEHMGKNTTGLSHMKPPVEKKRGVTAHTHCFKMYITHTGYEKHAH